MQRELHKHCDETWDLATVSILENCIDEAKGRTWFLAKTACSEDLLGAASSGA